MFYGTTLEPLILAGVNTHACIRTAAIDTYQRDFQVIVVRDCVASKDPELHEITLDYLNGGIASVVGLSELEQAGWR